MYLQLLSGRTDIGLMEGGGVLEGEGQGEGELGVDFCHDMAAHGEGGRPYRVERREGQGRWGFGGQQ